MTDTAPDVPEDITPEPEPLTPLQQLEAEHGFTFGHDGDTPPSPTRVLSCSNPACEHVNRMVQIHDDTILPLFCGCGQVLHCDHVDTIPSQTHGGTLGNPTLTNRVVCVACQTVVSEDTIVLPPVRFEDIPLADVPAAAAVLAAREPQP